MRARKEVGIRRRRDGWRVFAKVNGKVRVCPQFPLDTPVGELRAARDKLIEQYGGGPLPEAGTFAADVARYLAKPEVAAMPSFKQRAALLECWLEALGRSRARRSIQRDEVEAVLQRWLTTLAPVTVYHRRTALGRLFTVLDGPTAPNPVKGTTRPDHYRPVDRSIDFHTIEKILAAMPAERYTAKGIRKPSLAKLRATVIAHTGIPPGELMKLKPHDFDRHAGIVRMPWRNKGAGTPAHTRELSPAGVAAFVALDAGHGWGRFPVEALGRSFKRAAKAILGPSTAFRLYNLRHSLGADVYRTTRDLATVGRLLGHAEGSAITSRYAMGAHAEVDRAALEALTAYRTTAASLGQNRVGSPSRLPRLRKRQTPKTLLKTV